MIAGSFVTEASAKMTPEDLEKVKNFKNQDVFSPSFGPGPAIVNDGSRKLQSASGAVVEYDKDTVFDKFDEYDPIREQAVVDFEEQADMVALRKVVEGKRLDHEDSDREANAGAIAALVIGLIIFMGMLSYFLWKTCMMKKGGMGSSGARNGQTVFVN